MVLADLLLNNRQGSFAGKPSLISACLGKSACESYSSMKPPRINAPRAIAPAVEMLRSYLQSRIAEGVMFTCGQTIQFSWMWFQVGSERDELVIRGPKSGVMPIEFTTDCSDALNLVLTQRYVCDSFDANIGWCSAVQSAIVIKDIAQCRQIFMNRMEEQEGNVSGWFFGATDSQLDANDAESLELKSLWELSCDIPASADFFLLPSGWQVSFNERPLVFQGSKFVSARSDSYYAAKYQS